MNLLEELVLVTIKVGGDDEVQDHDLTMGNYSSRIVRYGWNDAETYRGTRG